jgi:hypothetical protein
MARRLFHYGVDIALKVNKVAAQGNKGRWSEASFTEAMGRAITSRGRGNDGSGFIMWRTDEKRFIRYENLRAMIVAPEIHRSTALPTKKRKLEGCFSFGTEKRVKGSYDQFFRWIWGGGQQTHLNHILMGRICDCIHQKYPDKKHPNHLPWKEHYTDIMTDEEINLGIFWVNCEVFVTTMTEFRKSKYNKGAYDKAACMVNQAHWTYPPEGGIFPFLYPEWVETKMDGYLYVNNSKAAIAFASQGYLTEHFLQWLAEMKQYQKDTKNDDDPKTKLLEKANLPVTKG